MKRELTELSARLQAVVEEQICNRDFFANKLEEAAEIYNIPKGIAADILNGNKTVADYGNSFFGFLCTKLLAPELIDEFFTASEIAIWNDAKYVVDELKEIKIPMIKVCEDQWIGATTLDFLLSIDENHLMRYNESTQRILRKKMGSNGIVKYQPYINTAAVNQICDLMKSGTYISNTITFNVIPSDEYEVRYKDGELIIKGFPKDKPIFDILDGYHRFRAMKRLRMADPAFDYPMELRIVEFSEEKAKQFIFQEDQKTKMRVVDSKTYNQDDLANRVVDELNDAGSFRGMLTRNSTAIDMSVFGDAIRQTYFTSKDPKSRKWMREVIDDINNKAKWLEKVEPDKFDQRWSTNDIVEFVSVARYSKTEDEFNRLKRLVAYNDQLKGSAKRSEVAKYVKRAREVISKGDK